MIKFWPFKLIKLNFHNQYVANLIITAISIVQNKSGKVVSPVIVPLRRTF